MLDPIDAHSDRTSAILLELSASGFDNAVEIGRGGFGVVYRCTQQTLDREVAVKVLVDQGKDNRRRFLREQQAMGRLTGHPNIVSVLEAGETPAGLAFLVMPYVGRGSIDERIRNLGGLPLDTVLRLGIKVAGALDAAHRVGIVHRDVKPSNILLSEYGEPALCDFGVAVVSDGLGATSGAFGGTPSYAAPEVIEGEAPTAASDVYSLGATLFSALLGHPPHQRRTDEQLVSQLYRIVSGSTEAIRESGLPDDIAAAIGAAMALDPGDRPTAQEFGEHLRRLQSVRLRDAGEFAVQARAVSGEPVQVTMPAVAPSPSAGQIPTQRSSLVGRQTELFEIRSLLSTSPLVTVTGVGGIGKTTVAMQVAREVGPQFTDGVWLIELAELNDGAMLDEVVAATLGVRDPSGLGPRGAVVNFLEMREALLVLDNCEHVIGDIADLVQAFLQRCARLRILATSRETMNIAGESVYQLLSLPYPTDHSASDDGSDCDAVDLFIERARSAVKDFAITEQNRATVAEICRKLEGVPLAVELAAARLRALSVEQIAEGLGDRYRLLSRGYRGAPARQNSLLMSVAWSADLCSPGERELWGRLTVFTGPFDLESAREVCGQDIGPEQFFDGIAALVEKSILLRNDHEGSGVDFWMLETLREYGKAYLLSTDEWDQRRARHAQWYRQRLATSDREWFGSGQLRWLGRITRDMPNIRDALQFSLEHAPSHALRMGAHLRHVWSCRRGLTFEAQRWLSAILAATPPEPSPERIRVLCSVAELSAYSAECVSVARGRVQEARSYLEEIDDAVGVGLVDHADGHLALVSGDLATASECFERALTVTDSYEVQLGSMLLLGWVREMTGKADEALRLFQTALAVAEARPGETSRHVFALISLGDALFSRGDIDGAERLIRDSLELSALLDSIFTTLLGVEGLAWVAEVRADYQRAAILMGAAAALCERLGSEPSTIPGMRLHHASCEARTRAALGCDDFDEAWRTGASLTAHEAIGVALDPSHLSATLE
ncbi:protein kinase [Mycolicibacterium boenickei]